MKIIIDGDGCPVVSETIEAAKKHSCPVVLVCDTAHIMHSDYAECITADKGSDSADLVIINKTAAGDIVITQDYGLAALCLAKKAIPVNQDGMIYTADNIDRLLMQRHINKKIRRAGGRTAHAKKRRPEQTEAFKCTLAKILEEKNG